MTFVILRQVYLPKNLLFAPVRGCCGNPPLRSVPPKAQNRSRYPAAFREPESVALLTGSAAWIWKAVSEALMGFVAGQPCRVPLFCYICRKVERYSDDNH